MLNSKEAKQVSHILPHTHWDREWYKTFQQFRIRLVRLIDRLLDILAEDETYGHFMLDGQTRLLEDYLEIRPERKEEIARLVQEGRLSVGPWYVLPDEFLVSPESLLRNLMLGDEISQRFGEAMSIGYVPDLFGHIAQLPQILQGFSMQTAVLRRGLGKEPLELWWDAPDGSRVLICYLRNGYDNATRLPMTNAKAFVHAINIASERLVPHSVSKQILLMAGNDHQEPDPRLPNLIRYANKKDESEGLLRHSSLPDYVASVYEAIKDQNLLSITGELRDPEIHHLLPGVLSARMWIKQRNDAVETLLLRWTEPFAAWAELLEGSMTPSASHTHLSGHETLAFIPNNLPLIGQAWRLLLDNHPHDSICGCSVDQVHREMAFRFDQSEQIAEEISQLSLRTIAKHVNTLSLLPEDGSEVNVQPLLIFNPTDGPRSDLVTIQICLPELETQGWELVNSAGQSLPYSASTSKLSEEERVFFDQKLSPEEFRSYLSRVRGGRLLEFVINKIQVVRNEPDIDLILLIGKNGAPNRAEVSKAQAKIEEIQANGEVAHFNIRVLMAELSELSFVAKDLPAYGFETFAMRPARTQVAKTQVSETNADSYSIENDLFLIEVDPKYGTFSLTDKRTETKYTGLNKFVDGGDRGDTYNYCEPEQDELISLPIEVKIQLLKQDAVQQVLEIHQHYLLPVSLADDRAKRSEETASLSIISRVNMFTAVPRIDIETNVDNKIEDHRLRVHFPLHSSSPLAHNETHFHVAKRPLPSLNPDLDTSDWKEQPMPTLPQRGWASLSDGQHGFMIANKGLPELEFISDGEKTSIALTLLRSVGWLSRDDIHCRQGRAGSLIMTPEAQCLEPYTFHYSIIPHEGDWQQVAPLAEAFRAPLRAVSSDIQAGNLASKASLMHVEPASFVLSTVKQPQDTTGKGLIVRGVNMSDEPITVCLRPGQVFEKAFFTNLNEVTKESLEVALDGSVSFAVNGWQIVTVKFENTKRN